MNARLLLFDIDGTLLLTGGAGKRAMERAFFELFGVADALSGVSMAGRTDRWLAELALTRHGLDASAERLESFRARYLAALESSIHEPGRGHRGLLPGVEPLLDRLALCDQWHLALLTGNYRDGARIKLSHFGLWNRFAWGAFGDEHAERGALARAAVDAAPAQGVTIADARHAVVIGDTPFDIACARAAGASVVAVATGGHSREELAAHEPDLLVDDLTDIDAIESFLARA
ncbi:MAG: haloacid dehalogenase-like hydrolase [Vicinamibacterales bacterium]